MDTNKRPFYVSAIVAVVVGAVFLCQLLGIDLPFTISASAILGE